MKMESHPYNFPISEYFPIRRLFAGFEGGSLELAEKDGKYYLIADEGTLADFLLPEDADLLNQLIKIYEFNSEAEREQYIHKQGWDGSPIIDRKSVRHASPFDGDITDDNIRKRETMNTYEQIISRQIEWAKNKGLELVGSKGQRGRKDYTICIEKNLFQKLNDETRTDLMHGDGGELIGSEGQPAKIQALHSSSALGINVFDYWRIKIDLSVITTACGLSRGGHKLAGEIRFEQKYPIVDGFPHSPNIDVVIRPETGPYKAYAIECKFTEAYSSRKHGGMDDKYLKNKEIWKNLSATRKLAQDIYPDDPYNEHLHAAQLIKHILGLNRAYGPARYRLLYLWYDALGEPGSIHRQEINEFSSMVGSDGVKFHATTCQELIRSLARHREDHPDYVRYLTERYL